MAQAVSRRPFTAEILAQAQSVHLGFVVDEGAVEQVCVRSSSVFSCQHHSTLALHTHTSTGDELCGRSSETYSHPIDMNNKKSIPF
jgi:hypothetical protein